MGQAAPRHREGPPPGRVPASTIRAQCPGRWAPARVADTATRRRLLAGRRRVPEHHIAGEDQRRWLPWCTPASYKCTDTLHTPSSAACMCAIAMIMGVGRQWRRSVGSDETERAGNTRCLTRGMVDFPQESGFCTNRPTGWGAPPSGSHFRRWKSRARVAGRPNRKPARFAPIAARRYARRQLGSEASGPRRRSRRPTRSSRSRNSAGSPDPHQRPGSVGQAGDRTAGSAASALWYRW